ncbi:MAG TPA: hypothetical protein VGJ04_06570 [Pirellulales bacterium]
MDFLNKSLTQLTDLFRSMSPAGRMVVALLLLVAVISGAYLFNHGLPGSDGYLFGGESVAASQLPAIEAAFGKKNLTDYELQGNRIRVPQGKQSLYMAALADSGALPHNFLDSLKASLESGGPFVDRKKRDDLFKVALQDELSKIVGQMNGIERANVLYNIETPQGFNAKKLVTVSVTVKPAGNQTLNAEQVQMIRQAVGPAIGAAPQSIAVIDINCRAYPGGEMSGSSDVSQDRYMNTKHQYEREFADSIRQALVSFVQGAVVTVNVELHPELEESETTDKVDPKPVNSGSPETSRTTIAAIPSLPSGLLIMPPPAGVPNSPLTVAPMGTGLRSESEPPVRHEQDVISRQSRQVRKAGLTPKRVSVSVGVPSSYYEEVWRQRNPAPAASKPGPLELGQIEMDVNANIKKCVMGIVPMPDNSTADPVTVTSFTSMPVPQIEIPTPTDRALVFVNEHSSALVTGVLVLIGLLVVRSIVRSISSATSREMHEPAVETMLADEIAEQPFSPRGTPRTHRRHNKVGPSLRDELVEIVRDDPDAAANVLRNWIGTTN